MRNWLKKFRLFFNFPFAEKLLLVRAFTIIILLKLGIKLLSFQQFKTFYAKLIETADSINFSSEEIEQYVWAIKTVSPDLKAECLPQALALKYFLRKDKSVKVVIGVNQTNGFGAHAWVESDDKILIGESLNREFQTLWSWS